ncbi:RNA polymerase sigma factor [Lishizhenia sp.]|uniref:RNA polymerase sigma factor n=1 Tax=Lishizhenia sp. TaxID=2497594 RepID=UPI00299F2966|nr:sigma-70 family RNA polymerase sigma factor [Lishizhenia sp.]MDX1446186.1 sigma-70 family RNA polymerase sigma factor [Lishizhenia sp.]
MSSYKQLKDEELMHRLTKGDESAFNELYSRYAQRILLFMYKMLKQDEARAQDFTQDVFLKVVEAAEGFDRNKSFKTWVFTIAANLCKNHFRKNVGDIREIQNTSLQISNQAEDKMDRELKNQALKEEIAALPSPYRETFVLRYSEELKVKEIAQAQNIPEGTVKSRLNKATQILAEKMRLFTKVQH